MPSSIINIDEPVSPLLKSVSDCFRNLGVHKLVRFNKSFGERELKIDIFESIASETIYSRIPLLY
jgi:hypothetical protein